MKIDLRLVAVLACFMSSALPSFAESLQSQVPLTGQTKCYDTESGVVVPCAGTGQDGEFQMGVPWPTPRFTKPDGTTPINGNVVVIDQLTGLMWANASMPVGKTSWGIANSVIAQMNVGAGTFGYTDWRLPNRNELTSLAYNGEGNMAASFVAQGLPYVKTDSCYLSSTTSPVNTSNAWCVDLAGATYVVNKSSAYFYVWPVRGTSAGAVTLARTGQTSSYAARDDGDLELGAAWPVPRFASNGDFTMTDRLTGLIWTKDANGPGPDACRAYGGWGGLLNYVDCLNGNNFLGHNDWRLPNRNELSTLAPVSWGPVSLLTSQGFTNVQSAPYYSSSSYSAAGAGAIWTVSMADGAVSWTGGNDGTAKAWPVRGPIAPRLGVSPAGRDFGMVDLGSISAPQIFTISNTGSAMLTVNEIVLAGPDAAEFSLVPGDGSDGTCGGLTPIIAAGGSCSIFAEFEPKSAGYKTAALVMASNDPTSSSTALELRGTGALPAFPLTVRIKGNGGGAINTVPSGLSCDSGSCSGDYLAGEQVTLVATASSDSTFHGWDGACTGTGNCSLVIDMVTLVNATFDLAHPVRIKTAAPEYYQSLQAAYDAAATGAVIQHREGDFVQSLTANKAIGVKLSGGYNSEYSSRNGSSKWGGPMLLRSGTVTADKVFLY